MKENYYSFDLDPANPPINNKQIYDEEGASKYCSFGIDDNGNNLTGYITETTFEQVCENGQYICECIDFKPEPNILIVTEKEDDEFLSSISSGVLLLGGVIAFIFIALIAFVFVCCWCCCRNCCFRGRRRPGQNEQ